MNSSRHWLILFIIVLTLLVVATVSLVLLTKDDKVALLQENTPQGTVQRYLMAIQEKDYQSAYSYLSFEPSQKQVTYIEWLNMVTDYLQPVQTTWKATLGEITQQGNYATVEVTIDAVRPSGFFMNPSISQQITFHLYETDGKWLITSPTYVYWIY